jgi:hypothetical protein
VLLAVHALVKYWIWGSVSRAQILAAPTDWPVYFSGDGVRTVSQKVESGPNGISVLPDGWRAPRAACGSGLAQGSRKISWVPIRRQITWGSPAFCCRP